jgi:hypothetical protein
MFAPGYTNDVRQSGAPLLQMPLSRANPHARYRCNADILDFNAGAGSD